LDGVQFLPLLFLRFVNQIARLLNPQNEVEMGSARAAGAVFRALAQNIDGG